MANQLALNRAKVRELSLQVAHEQSGTLAMYGIDSDRFKSTLVEAILSNPNIQKAKEVELARALREACQNGVLPNGREGAIIVNRDGGVRFLAMRDGICKLFHRAFPGSEIRSGFIRKGQDVKIISDTFEGDRVVIEYTFGAEPDTEIIGSWCSVQVPGHKPVVGVFNKLDIEQARKASNVRGQGGPWDVWEGRMAEKAVVKSTVRKALYMFSGVNEQIQSLVSSQLDADDKEEYGDDVVEVEAKEVPKAEPVKAVEKPKPERTLEPKPKPKPEPAPVEDDMSTPWDDPPTPQDDDIDLPEI